MVEAEWLVILVDLWDGVYDSPIGWLAVCGGR